ncbi:shikimate kinase [Hymenobacter sp. RP-2-7]|uniref:Shikimate kinase n=1 Tax=Hymenobacter polaris TaxID=2682546 RepID=A0A7Y0FP18_9BACT|nr:shikimate kinase [Hymenobacter polaris]NML66944.1 shikimate kinase [Hymenobacter polaris]
MPNHLYLIGLPGSGKTTLGRQLAAHYGRAFVDLDDVLVAAAGQSIPAIFAAEGEAGFRAREAAALAALAEHAGPPLVVATGGGTPCFHDNLAVLRRTGFVLWLAVPVPELARRLAATGQAAARPLLAATAAEQSPETALLAHLTRTLAAREEFYAQAHLHHSGAASAAEVAAALAAAGFRP